MAEKQQKANHKASLIPLRSESAAFIAATLGVTFLPWLLIISAVVLAIHGLDTAAWIAALTGIVSGGPQIITATKRAFGTQPTAQSPTPKPGPGSTPKA